MKKIGVLVRPLTKPIENVHGIAGFSDWKFYAVFLLYSASFIAFASDPFFLLRGGVVFQQGMITLLLAVVLLNTLHWDFLLFGKPSNANLLLQLFSYLPGAFFIARLFGKATKPECVSTGENLLLFIKEKGNVFMPVFPSWLSDLFCNWKISLVFVLLLVVLSLNIRKQFKVAAVYLFLLIPFLAEITGKRPEYLIIGTVLFAFGLGLQFCRYDYVVYFERIDESLRQSSNIDTLLLRSIMRIMSRLYQDSELSENDVREIVSDVYNAGKAPGNEYSDMEINQIAAEVIRKMIHSFNLVNIQQSNRGAAMFPNRRLFIYDNALRGIAVFPRILVVLLFVIIWWISPIDIFPDALPLIGTIDDVLAGMATMLMLSSSTSRRQTH